MKKCQAQARLSVSTFFYASGALLRKMKAGVARIKSRRTNKCQMVANGNMDISFQGKMFGMCTLN